MKENESRTEPHEPEQDEEHMDKSMKSITIDKTNSLVKIKSSVRSCMDSSRRTYWEKQSKSHVTKYEYKKPRSNVDFETTLRFLSSQEIPIQKYNYSLEKKYQNFDKFYAALKIAPDGNSFDIFNLKLQEYAQRGNY